MAKSIKISIIVDKTAQKVRLFKTLKNFSLNKIELFKLAILGWEVPKKAKEKDYIYLQSKVPHLEELISDFIEFRQGSIINHSEGDRTKKQISEYLGIAVGLKYSMKLLNVNPNKFSKIGRPTTGKYLDYSVVANSFRYDIETKGTVSVNYNAMKEDILAKKKGSKRKNIHLKYGTIALLSNENRPRKASCVVIDDPPTQFQSKDGNSYEPQLLNYTTVLSFTLDSKFYNKVVKNVLSRKEKRIRISKNRFFGKYVFEGITFLGECFDYRLIREEDDKSQKNRTSTFNQITKTVGKTKIFIGLDEKIITSINSEDFNFLSEYRTNEKYIDGPFITKYLSEDGILIVKSKNQKDQQLEDIFPEEIVNERYELGNAYELRRPHKCNAPCTSPGIEGKPCERLTYRKYCFFHR